MELINAWMEDEKLVDATLWPHRRFEMWLQLRTLNGLDLPSFLRGTAHAYVGAEPYPHTNTGPGPGRKPDPNPKQWCRRSCTSASGTR